MFNLFRLTHLFHQLVSIMPEVRTVQLDENIDFLVIATDGLWDLWSNREVVKFIRERLEEEEELHRIGQAIIAARSTPMKDGVAGSDNITVLIAVFK